MKQSHPAFFHFRYRFNPQTYKILLNKTLRLKKKNMAANVTVFFDMVAAVSVAA